MKLKTSRWMWTAGAFALGLALGVVDQARAAEPAGKAAPPQQGQEPSNAGNKGSGKAKAGEACKSNSDCDQSQSPMICRDAKCRVHIPPPT